MSSSKSQLSISTYKVLRKTEKYPRPMLSLDIVNFTSEFTLKQSEITYMYIENLLVSNIIAISNIIVIVYRNQGFPSTYLECSKVYHCIYKVCVSFC